MLTVMDVVVLSMAVAFGAWYGTRRIEGSNIKNCSKISYSTSFMVPESLNI